MTDSSLQKISRQLTVTNQSGFHLRVAAMISKAAAEYDADIFLANGSYRADCKSCLDLLAVMAPCGTVLTLEIQGNRAEEIADRFSEMFRTKFGEDEFAPAEG